LILHSTLSAIKQTESATSGGQCLCNLWLPCCA